MDVIDTIPQLREARINGIDGLGYAEFSTHISGHTCRGVVLFDSDTDLGTLKNRHPEDTAVFEGILFYNGEEIAETLHVNVVYTSFDEEADPGLTFRAKMEPKII